MERRICSFSLAVKSGYPAIPLPELQIVTIDQRLGRFDSRIVVFAAKVDASNEMAV
jgi:hypothetical protein